MSQKSRIILQGKTVKTQGDFNPKLPAPATGNRYFRSYKDAGHTPYALSCRAERMANLDLFFLPPLINYTYSKSNPTKN